MQGGVWGQGGAEEAQVCREDCQGVGKVEGGEKEDFMKQFYTLYMFVCFRIQLNKNDQVVIYNLLD